MDNLRQKIARMLIVGFDGKDITSDSAIASAIQEHQLGGVILFDKNIESPEQVRALNTKLQHYNQTESPLLISVDYEGGAVNRLSEAKGFPKTYSAKAIAEEGEAFAFKAADTMALTLKSLGFNVNFAPVLDINSNADNPIIAGKDRSFSKNPDDVVRFAQIYAEQFVRQGIQPVYKHFPGHGSSMGDSHLGFVDVTDTWKPEELRPFQQLLNHKSSQMVMTAHIVNQHLDESGLPATLSHRMLTGILRGELGFDGVIVSDDMQMKAITDHYGLEQALVLAINAGVDLFIFGNQLADEPEDTIALIDLIEKNVKANTISEARILEAYRRRLGRFDPTNQSKKITANANGRNNTG